MKASWLTGTVFGVEGRYGSYGAPIDIKVLADTTTGATRSLDVSFTALSPGMAEVPRRAVLSATQVFTPIHHTLAAVFARVVPMAAHVPSYADTWGWNVAFLDEEPEAAAANGTAPNGNGLPKKSPTAALLRGRLPATADEADAALSAALPSGHELVFLDGSGLMGALALNKIVRRAIAEEDHVYTVDSPCVEFFSSSFPRRLPVVPSWSRPPSVFSLSLFAALSFSFPSLPSEH